jgi:hypothetical protein
MATAILPYLGQGRPRNRRTYGVVHVLLHILLLGLHTWTWVLVYILLFVIHFDVRLTHGSKLILCGSWGTSGGGGFLGCFLRWHLGKLRDENESEMR